MTAFDGLQLDVEVFGERIMSRHMLSRADRIDDFGPAFRRIADLLRNVARKQFDSEGEYASGGWKPLAEATVERKRKAGLDPRILHATGALRDSLTGRGAGHIQKVLPQALHWGSSVAYGKFHQSGTSRMPQRRPFNLREPDRRAVMKELQRHIAETLDANAAA